MCSNGLSLLPQMVSLVKEHRPQGIGLMDITKEFYNMYGKRLNPNDYNYQSLYELIEELIEKCNKSLVLVKHNTNQFKCDRIFIDDNAYEQWIQNFKISNNLRALETVVIPLLPKDVPLQHKTHCLIPSNSVPDNAFDGNQITSFRVEVVYVENPNLIFVRLGDNKAIYHNLKQMLRFYDGIEERTNAYILPKELAFVGYLCAVRNPMDWENWHRAVIVGTDSDIITLYAFDYGNVIIEDRKALRLLKSSFCSFPPQVIRVSLSGIAPNRCVQNKYKWSEDSIQCLKSLVDKYKTNIQCIFLFQLSNNYFSVFLQSWVELDIEDVPKHFSIYFHEMLIKNGFADMILKDFNELNQNNRKPVDLVSEAIEEPLLAIKYEHEFGEYESPALPPEVLAKEIKSEKCDQTEEFVSVEPNVMLNEVLTTEVTTSPQNAKEINYKRLYFTADKSPETLLSQYYPKSKSDAVPIVERKYFNEDMIENAFPCFERKYFNETLEKNELSALKLKYFKEDKEAFPPSMFKYRPEAGEASNSVGTQYYSQSNASDDSISYRYFTSDDCPSDCPLEEHKYYQADLI